MSIRNQHIQRSYRVHNLRGQDWIVGASGGTVSNGKATLSSLGEQVLTPFYAPWDLDPSFPLQFRYIYTADGATGRKARFNLSVTCAGETTLVDGETLTIDGVQFTVDAGFGGSLNPAGTTSPIAVTAVDYGVFSYTVPVFVWTGHPNITNTVIALETQAGADESPIEISIQYQYGTMSGALPAQGVDAEPFNTDWSWADDLTEPIGEHTPASPTIIAQKSPIGTLTLPSETRRDFYLNLRATNMTNIAVSILALQVAYVPLISDNIVGTAGGTRTEPWT